jgi:hypothetical protein
MVTETSVNIAVLSAVAAPLVGLFIAAALYARYRKPKTGLGRRSALLFGFGTLLTGFVLGYVSHAHLGWPICVALAHLDADAWCGVTPYVAPPLGFTLGLLAFALAWSLKGMRPNSTSHADARGRAGLNQPASARAGERGR